MLWSAASAGAATGVPTAPTPPPIAWGPGGRGGSGLDLPAFVVPVLDEDGYTSTVADYDWIGRCCTT
jgi:hypothetical protein